MIVRSTKRLVVDARSGEEAIIALRINNWTKEFKNNRYKAEVEDCIVTDAINPSSGEPLKKYKQFNSKIVFYSNNEIDALFTQIGQNINSEQSYTEKQNELIAQALLIVTQQKPIYQSTAEDWELVNETIEIQPSEA